MHFFIFQVFFVDFGNTDTVELSNLCRLSAELTQIPIQATRCSLSGIFPLFGNLWDDDAVSRFNELIEAELTAKVVKVRCTFVVVKYFPMIVHHIEN